MRISTEDLERKRNDRSSRILITGATGFLGSHLAARLLESDFRVTILARQTASSPAADRVRRVMDWHGVTPEAQRRLNVAEGDILDSSLSLPAATDEIIHCASETSFAERRRARIEAVNLRGTERLLDLAAANGCGAFHYVSTAFAAGRSEGVCRESLFAPGQFHNPYEETKCRAEQTVWQRCRAAGIRPVIYRPSIVYGHSITGRSLLFNALYHPVRAAVFLRDIYVRDIRENGGGKARAAGVRIADDGSTVHLPLRVAAEGPGLDLIPVDYFVNAFTAVFEAALEGGVFHLVSGRPTPIAAIADFMCRMFKMSGVEAVSPAALESGHKNPIEASFARMIEVYQPYLSDRRAFATDNSGPILESMGVSRPHFTYEVFQRCMSYAVAAGWRSGAGAPI